MGLFKKKKHRFSPGEHPVPRQWVTAAECGNPQFVHAASTLSVPYFPLPRGNFDLSPITTMPAGERYDFPATFAIELPKGRILERDGVVLTQENALLADTAIHFGRPISQHRIFSHQSLPNPLLLKQRLAVLSSIDPHVYFHWMCNILPRLELLHRSGLGFDALYLPQLTRPFQNDTLQHLGIEQAKIVYEQPGTQIEAEHLVVPSLPAAPCDCPPWVCDFLRNAFLPQQMPEPTRHLYLSRAGARRRQVVNEVALMEVLATRGFEQVVLDGLPVAEQARLFASAKTIVSPHGAGLTNLVFCQPGTKVVEIFHPDWICDCYWQVSHYLRLDHCVMLARKGYRNLVNRFNDRNRDSWVQLDQLQEMLG